MYADFHIHTQILISLVRKPKSTSFSKSPATKKKDKEKKQEILNETLANYND